MDISAVNSLAECGVGVNLAFGLIQGLRDGLTKIFEGWFETRFQRTQANLNDALAQSDGRAASKIAVKADDIRQKYRIHS